LQIPTNSLPERTKAVGIARCEYIQAKTIGDGGTSATNGTKPAAKTGGAAGPVFCSLFTGINAFQGLVKDVADQGGEFSAGVHFTIGQDRNKIESRATTETGASTGQRPLVLVKGQVEKVIFEAERGNCCCNPKDQQ